MWRSGDETKVGNSEAVPSGIPERSSLASQPTSFRSTDRAILKAIGAAEESGLARETREEDGAFKAHREEGKSKGPRQPCYVAR